MAEKIIQYLADIDIAHALDELPEPHNALVHHMHDMGATVLDRNDDTATAHAVVAEFTEPYDGQLEQILHARHELGKSVLLLRQYRPSAVRLPDELIDVSSMGRGGIVTYRETWLAKNALTAFLGVSFEGEPRILATSRLSMSLREEMRHSGQPVRKSDIPAMDVADEADRQEHGWYEKS